MCVCVCVVCVCVHAFARVREHARVSVRVCVRDVFAIYDNNILTQADNDSNLK